MVELILGTLALVGLVLLLYSSRGNDRRMYQVRGVSIEGLANQFKAVFESLQRDIFDRNTLYATVAQQVVKKNRWNTPDDYGTQLVSHLTEIYKDDLQCRTVVEMAIVFCVKDIY